MDGDLEYLKHWLAQDQNDVNGRDFNGRTPLHVAALSSTAEVVQYLLDHRAQLTVRLEDRKNAIHLACIRGDLEILSLLLRKSRKQWSSMASSTRRQTS